MIGRDAKKAPEWMLSGNCARPENVRVIFVPDKGQSTAAAKQICSTCPFTSECLDYALVYNMEGIWGGTTTGWRERQFSSEVRDMVRDDYFDAA